MAGLGYRTFTAGAVLTAAQVQGYLQDQVVMDFASNAARTSALASPSQGMVSYLTDSNSYWQYYEAYNAGTNPGGASVAGWYPQEGTTLFAGKRTNSSGISIPNATYTVVNFNSFSCAGSTSNTDTIQINSATVPSTFTVRKAGWYRLSSAAKHSGWSTTAGANRTFAINKNSTTFSTNTIVVGPATVFPNDGYVVTYGTVNTLLAANDIVRFFLYQDSGGNATCADHSVTIEYLRPASV
jgi:hypothetical protein